MTNTKFGIDGLPEVLRERAANELDGLRRDRPGLLERLAGSTLEDRFASLLATSEFAAGVIRRWPELAEQLLDAERLTGAGRLDCEIANAGELDEQAFAARLRQIRQRELLAIAWRDLTAQASTDDTLGQVSALADSLISQASDFALDKQAQRLESRPAPPIILAMGKLGGDELNFSSDVDLVFLFADEFPDAARFYLRHAQRVIALLDQRSEYGFVFRVDTRLRPFGNTGALTLSLGAFEDYLHTHGREWERYAYVKARAVTGEAQHRERVDEALRSFVYRRYIDYGLFESLREMKGMIEEDVASRSLDHDIKRGDGGIREIEFIVQALQLIRGGRQRTLQVCGLREAMAELTRLGHLSRVTEQELGSAYRFLRRLENRLQMWRDQQTHVVPTGELDRARLAYSMDAEGWSELDGQIELHREKVSGRFADLLGPTSDPGGATHSTGHLLWHERLDRQQADEALSGAGVARPAVVIEALERVQRSASLARLDRRGRRRLDKLMPAVIDQAALRHDGEIVFPRIVEIVEGVGRRSAYFSLLNENPQVLERLIDLCSRSANISVQVAANPLLLDCLIDPSVVHLPTPAQRAEQLDVALAEVADDDLEMLIDTLTHFKHTATFEVAVADLSSNLTVMKVSDHLTSTAETVITAILAASRSVLFKRHGEPQADSPSAGFCVVAYGKLGGLELGYGSDLDLVFVYDSGAGDPPTTGSRPVASSVYYARLVQRFAHITASPTRFGALYQLDMRLRPSGNAGPLATSIEAFSRYQHENAWTWEHQALLRARPVAGDVALASRFAEVRREILLTRRDRGQLEQDILKMRDRLRKARYEERAGKFDIKHGPGGLLDTEFLIQFWLLLHAHSRPELIEFSDHMRQLDALAASGTVAAETCRIVQAAYLDYRTAVHRLTLLGEPRVVGDERFADHRARIESLWRETFPALL